MSSEELGYWTLPKPDIEVKEWRRIPRVARTIPFGYEVDPDDADFLLPIKNELDALEQAKAHLKQYSYREVANWLSKETGRYISHMGLKKRIQVERRRKKSTTIKRSLPEGSKRRYKRSKKPKQIEQVATQQKEQLPEIKIKPQEVQEQDVLFRPNEGPQTDFLASSEREVLYGGAAGGGKSFAMLADPLRGLNNPNFSGLLVRHTTEELRELIQKSQELYPKAIPGIKWSERKSQWVTLRGDDFGCHT